MLLSLHEVFEKGPNAYFHCSYPQKPINLVRSINKILAKVLATRMNQVLVSLLLDSQNAFIRVDKF
jgi:hypothetical protein